MDQSLGADYSAASAGSAAPGLAVARSGAVDLISSPANLRCSASSRSRKSNVADTTVAGAGRADAPGSRVRDGSLPAKGTLLAKGTAGSFSAALFTVSTTCLIASRVISWLLRTMPSTCSCTSPVTVAVMLTSSVRADAANYIKHAAHVKQLARHMQHLPGAARPRSGPSW